MKPHHYLSLIFVFFLFSCSEDTGLIKIQNNLVDSQVKYAIRQYQSESTLNRLKTNPSVRKWSISTGLDIALGSEAYKIRTNGDEIKVTGGDGTGLMYGLLHVKEQLEEGKEKIADIEESPRFPFRAIKFNLPWSAYRKAKALEIHKETCRDLMFWESFLDMMVENRFNALSLWSLHPFPYMIRNEDFFCLRWCEPDFIREHIRLNGQSYVGGYYLGSECYIPAKNYMTPPELAQGYAFERQWLYYKTWGRLLYNPETPDETFISACKARYGESGETLFKALKLGSRMPLRLATFFKGNWDFSLYSEGFLSHYAEEKSRGLITVNDLILREPMDPDYLSIPGYVDLVQSGEAVPEGKISPLALADSLISDGKQALDLIQGLSGTQNRALEIELADAEAWAWLSKYFGNKLKASVALHSFRTNRVAEDKVLAIDYISKAAVNWDELVEVTTPVYSHMPLGHIHLYQGLPKDDVRDFHWKEIQPLVHQEVILVKHEK